MIRPVYHQLLSLEISAGQSSRLNLNLKSSWAEKEEVNLAKKLIINLVEYNCDLPPVAFYQLYFSLEKF